jgi:hypothetical protein
MKINKSLSSVLYLIVIAIFTFFIYNKVFSVKKSNTGSLEDFQGCRTGFCS